MEEQKQLIRIEQRNYQDLGKLPKVRGYDTCSGEIGCRPEVFARCYRGVQSFAKEVNADWIHWTYHVGEDFLDLVDGLRAIDEAVLFCQLPRGSRLGHGMALGLDAVSYYQLKQRKILLPGQDLMDNIAWTLGFCREHGIVIRSTLRKKLEEKFSDLHRKIYGEVPLQDAGERADGEAARQIEAPDSETLARREAAAARVGGNVYDHSYYDAWKLRGDWPEYYLDDEENLNVLPPEAGLRMEETEEDQGEAANDVGFVFSGKPYGQKKSLKEIRADRRCREYYRRYHFSRQVREKGERPEFFEMDFAYMELIGRMQEEMRHLLTEKKIGIECNPTS
ncbi:MAG: hypothetical protein K2O70_09425, partial [Desulfovibrionaceae bacterium]|nr:hypothetical protein [Desulfovibrionaceae bacterium]